MGKLPVALASGEVTILESDLEVLKYKAEELDRIRRIEETKIKVSELPQMRIDAEKWRDHQANRGMVSIVSASKYDVLIEKAERLDILEKHMISNCVIDPSEYEDLLKKAKRLSEIEERARKEQTESKRILDKCDQLGPSPHDMMLRHNQWLIIETINRVLGWPEKEVVK